MKQWRKSLKPGDPVLFVRRENGRIYEWRATTFVRTDEGRPRIALLGLTSWTALLPIEAQAGIEAEDSARRAALRAKSLEREAAIQALWDAGADIACVGIGEYKFRPGHFPKTMTGYKRIDP